MRPPLMSSAVSSIDRGEALGAVAVDGEVAALDLGQARRQVGGRGEVGQQRREAIVGQAEEALVVPERVVGIERHEGDGHPAQAARRPASARRSCRIHTSRKRHSQSRTGGS